MPIAILDAFSGIAGDMLLGALVDVGLDESWLQALPVKLGLADVRVKISRVSRSSIQCVKVDFEIPPQPHGRHISAIRKIVAQAGVPPAVKERADAAFESIAQVEGELHGLPAEKVHLHEVGAVDAILDVVGSIWGMEQLGISAVYCGTIRLGDGSVKAAHGELPVPAPATLRILQGQRVSPGPEGSGELVTPTGAALVKVLSSGAVPESYVPLRSGFGAGTRDPADRPNALRVILAEESAAGSMVEQLVLLSADIDDMTGEYLAQASEMLRSAGALDVVLIPVQMKKGRPGARIEVLCTLECAAHLEMRVLQITSTLGVRRAFVERTALAREIREVNVLGHRVRVKLAALPDGDVRAKPEFDDVAHVSNLTGRSIPEISDLARRASEREL